MFGKLVKHEFKSVGKWYLGLYALTLAASILLGVWIRSIDSRADFSSQSEPILLGVVLFAYMAIIISVALSTLFLVINRFRKNVYGRQGYLTMTLPVTSHQIILSKLLVAVAWNILALLVIALSVIVILTISGVEELYSFVYNFEYVVDIASIAQYVFHQFVEGINNILLIYFAISIGQLFKDHRTLMAFVAYFGISFVVGMFTSMFYYSSLLAGTSSSSLTFLPSPIVTIFSMLLCGVYYFGTHYIMTKKLNLQ